MVMTNSQKRYKAKVRDKNLMRNYHDMTSEVRSFKDMPSALVKENRKRAEKLLGRPHRKTGCREHNNRPPEQNGFGHGLVTITMLRDGKKVTKKLPIQHANYLLYERDGEMPVLAESEDVYQTCGNPYCGKREHIETTTDPSQIVKGSRKGVQESKAKPKADSDKSKRREAVGKDDGSRVDSKPAETDGGKRKTKEGLFGPLPPEYQDKHKGQRKSSS